MSALDDNLRRWRQAGIIDAETAGRIEAFERERARGTSRPSFLEALVYLGVAILTVGVVILSAVNWDELRAPARVAVPAVPAVLAALAGFALRASGREELQRGAAIAWLAAPALTGLAAGILASELGWDESNVALAATVPAMAAGLAFWALSPGHVQVIGVVAALGGVSVATGTRADVDQAAIAGLLAVAFAAAALLLAEVGRFTPQVTARVLCSLLLVGGAFIAGLGSSPPTWAEALSFVAGASLITLSLTRGTFSHLAAGVAAIFLGLISVIVRHVDDPTLAALALMLLGGALVGAVLVLAKVRPWRGAAT